MSNVLEKPYLFWDARDVDPVKNAKFVIERILNFGDLDDFGWALDFYGKDKLKECFLESRTLDRKSANFWNNYFDIHNAS